MTADSSHRRRKFQYRLLDYLAQINSPALCVLGDLNVVEPDHRPICRHSETTPPC